jgi:hypothetical protein
MSTSIFLKSHPFIHATKKNCNRSPGVSETDMLGSDGNLRELGKTPDFQVFFSG